MNVKKEIITSRTNPLVVSVAKLKDRAEREKTGMFCCDGSKLVLEYIKNCGAPRYIFVDKDSAKRYLPELEALEDGTKELEVTLVSDSVFSKLTEQKAPEGIMCVGERNKLSYGKMSDALVSDVSDERILMLASLRDTGNVGTVIRTALALGYDRVVMSDDCADVLSPKTLRASMGAVFMMNITTSDDLAACVRSFTESGRRVFAGELRANSVSLEELQLKGSDIFIIGNEGHGIDSDVSHACSASVYIPISHLSESLNAASAATVFMWHQRTFAK